MNNFVKYCPKIWIVKSDELYEKGDIVEVQTGRGRFVEREIFKRLGEKNGSLFYSVIPIGKSFAEKKAEYWRGRQQEITLSMPESLEYFRAELEKAQQKYEGLKNGTIEREHSMSLSYARNKVKKLEKNLEIAEFLWGI